MKIDTLTNPEVVTLAVALLGGDSVYIDREDIALKADEIAHGRFSWRKYPDRIDLDAIGVALRDAKKEKNGALLTGTNSKGWMLSPSGAKLVSRLNISELGKEADKQRKDSIDSSYEAERQRMRNSKAYELFVSNSTQDIDIQAFYQFARVNEYFQGNVRQRRFTIIESAILDDTELSELWKRLKQMFPEELE